MTITMAHGSGGRETSALIREVFETSYGNPVLARMEDAAVLPAGERIALTTDSFVVQPLFFPGGDIGRLAVCGTVNDLLTSGAEPRYLTAGFILEEGLPVETLRTVARSMAETAAEAGVSIVAGDTKVVEGRGGMYINTAGVGILRGDAFTARAIRPGDALLLSGTLGEHHACILSQRMEINNDIRSDAAPLTGMVRSLLEERIGVRAIRDITRGGLATVLNELCEAAGCALELMEESLPVLPSVAGFCGVLGLDPLYMGNEGKMAFAVPWEEREAALSVLRLAPYGDQATIVGRFAEGKGVTLRTRIGGLRRIPPLSGEGLPRIC